MSDKPWIVIQVDDVGRAWFFADYETENQARTIARLIASQTDTVFEGASGGANQDESGRAYVGVTRFARQRYVDVFHEKDWPLIYDQDRVPR
jgi:hypothetical protein